MSDPVPAPGEPWTTPLDAAAMLDASPVASFVVDDDARVLFLNRAARRALGLAGDGDARRALGVKGGDLLGCIHALYWPGGCGRTPACGDCVIRGSIGRALAGGAVVRARMALDVERPEGFDQVTFLVSAAPARIDGRTVVILTLEDVSELVLLTTFLPCLDEQRRESSNAAGRPPP